MGAEAVPARFPVHIVEHALGARNGRGLCAEAERRDQREGEEQRT